MDTSVSSSHRLGLCSLLQEISELVSKESKWDKGFMECRVVNKCVDAVHYKDEHVKINLYFDELNVE